VPGAREFLLRAFEKDSGGRPGFESHDVVGTVKLLGTRPDRWASYPLPWLAGLPAPKDDTAIRVPFALGHPDPRAALTFKLLPARYMTDNGLKVDDLGFAAEPFGTGPFRLQGAVTPGDGPRELVFVDSANYGRWKDRTGLPHLREVRLVEVTRVDPITKNVVQTLDPVEAFRAGKLHVLTDIPTGDIPKFDGPDGGLAGRVQVVKAAVNRRVHVLAVNLTRPHLQSKALRQTISMAIDREKILNEVFRSGKQEFHRAMTGPYPPNSWAGGRGQLLYQRDAAVNKLKTYLEDAGAKLVVELAYATDDPRAEEACRKIKTAIEDVSKDVPGDRKLTVNLVRLPMQTLLLRVHEEHNQFDLAYVPFDYPDDWYPFALGAALDAQAAGRGGRNWFHFQSPETNPDADDLRLGPMLASLRGYRDVAGQLAPKSEETVKLFNECLPFIPLWQLDRHTVVSKNLKVYVEDTTDPVSARVLNPTTLFHGVARWRLE
jgi:ABC-type oligopeptide transport system substrate-binding subunit